MCRFHKINIFFTLKDYIFYELRHCKLNTNLNVKRLMSKMISSIDLKKNWIFSGLNSIANLIIYYDDILFIVVFLQYNTIDGFKSCRYLCISATSNDCVIRRNRSGGSNNIAS